VQVLDSTGGCYSACSGSPRLHRRPSRAASLPRTPWTVRHVTGFPIRDFYGPRWHPGGISRRARSPQASWPLGGKATAGGTSRSCCEPVRLCCEPIRRGRYASGAPATSLTAAARAYTVAASWLESAPTTQLGDCTRIEGRSASLR
jgi:hypothetical protein